MYLLWSDFAGDSISEESDSVRADDDQSRSLGGEDRSRAGSQGGGPGPAGTETAAAEGADAQLAFSNLLDGTRADASTAASSFKVSAGHVCMGFPMTYFWACACAGEARVHGAEFAEQRLAGEESQTVLHIRVHLGIRRFVGRLLCLFCCALTLVLWMGQVP